MTDLPNQWFDPHTLRKLSAQLSQVADILDPPSPPAGHQVVFPLHQIRESTWTPKLKKRGRPPSLRSGATSPSKKRKAKKVTRK